MATKKLNASDFVHLHNHTQYSLLDGLTKVPALIDFVKEHGMQAVSITDHGTMSGVVEFYKTATAAGVKPIIGMETYVAPRGHTDRDATKDKTPFHLILLAMNQTGYLNLMRLSTIANLEGFYYKPRIDHKLLEQYNEGLIVLSACIGGEIGDALRNDQYAQAVEIAKWYKSVFGDRYYLEIQDHGHPDHPSKWDEQVAVTTQTFKLAKELDIQCALTCDAHYLRHSDQTAHEILLCVQTGSFLSDEKRMSLKEFELHVTEPAELITRWGEEHPEIITNTRAIADRCEVQLRLGAYLIPKFPVPEKQTEKSYLHLLTYQGLVKRYTGQELVDRSVPDLKKLLDKDVVERAEYELGIVAGMGFNGYFLIVQDFINWGKDQGIVFGPGRGSGAGSIVAYALRITELDPLTYDLLFERFLNPDRISMPDFDIDIQDTRRDEVIQYCVQKYGVNRVANIVTFGRMAARNAVRDVARVLQVPYADADRLAKMIPPPVQGRHIPLAESLVNSADLKAEYQDNEQSKRVFDLAVQLEGTIRSHGVHAAGVVIAPDDIVKFVPLEKAQKGVVATQYPMGPIEELGLLKMDFLGLSNLTIIKNALRIIDKVYGKDIDIGTIPLDDAKTYKLLQRGETTGVFQLESAGMKRYLKQLKPTLFEDIVAMVALYRPGPMQFIDDFIARKHGQKNIEYLDPKMEGALSTTYGVLVYQEQVMQISKDLSGFTGGQADTLRKGIGKKDPAMLAKMKAQFIQGAVEHSQADTRVMEVLWKQLEDFAAYCFNKSHAACYAMIAYQTAYLKAHYPAAFMAALMTSDYDETDRLSIEIKECTSMDVPVLSPDVNESFTEFSVVLPEGVGKTSIRFGMTAIKNVGSGAVEEILRAREDKPFVSLEDFFERVTVRVVNRKALDSLIKAGALDRFGKRPDLLANIDVLLAYANRIQKEKASGQTDLFGNLDDSQMHAKPSLKLSTSTTEVSQREQLQWERELLGLYLSQHPLEDYQLWLSEQTVALPSITAAHHNKQVAIGGVITDAREIMTKKGQKMAFVRLADETGELELIVFPTVYEQSSGLWERDRIIAVKGKVMGEERDGSVATEPKVMVDSAREVTHTEVKDYAPTNKKAKPPKIKVAPKPATSESSSPKKLYLRLENSQDSLLLQELKKQIDTSPGDTAVVLVVGKDAHKQVIRLPLNTEPTESIMQGLGQLIGAENVKLH